MKHFLIAICLVFIFSGCCTFSVNKEIKDYSDPENEFSSNFKWEPKIYEGSYMGELKIGSNAYHHYLFENILLGSSNRILQILIPLDQGAYAEVSETVSYDKSTELDIAYLFSYFYSGGGINKYYGIRDTRKYFKDNYRKVDIKKYLPHILNINIRPKHFDLHSEVLILKNDQDTDELYWHAIDSLNNIKWNSRSRSKSSLMRLKYLYSIPVDIITFPFQLIAYLVVLNGNSL